jgi:hypothetical protein
MKIKSLVLDGIANYIFFVPIITTMGYFSGWIWEQFVVYWITSIPVGIFGGMIFGRFLNVWRKGFRYT